MSRTENMAKAASKSEEKSWCFTGQFKDDIHDSNEFDDATSGSLILTRRKSGYRSASIGQPELITLRFFIQYLMKHRDGLIFRHASSAPVLIQHNVMMVIFYFLFSDIAQLVTRPKTVLLSANRSNFSEDILGEMRALHKGLGLIKQRLPNPCLIFRHFKLRNLAAASMNADLETARCILETTSPDNLTRLLDSKISAVITHLGIERYGTPLQIAFYAGDVEMVSVYRKIMQPDVYERQLKEIFLKALSVNRKSAIQHDQATLIEYYDAMMSQLKSEAKTICRSSFISYVGSVTTVTISQEAIDDFQKKISEYVRSKPFHNPYFLRELCYVHLEFLNQDNVTGRDISSQKKNLFMVSAVGFMQKHSSLYWISCSLDGLLLPALDSRDTIKPTRRLIFRYGPKEDVRELIHSHLGTTHYISGVGSLRHITENIYSDELYEALKKFCSGRKRAFETLLTPNPAAAPEAACAN